MGLPKRLICSSCLTHSLTILFCMSSLLSQPSSAASTTLSASNNNTTDLTALLSFRSLIQDPSGTLTSWTNQTLHFCRWQGVMCGRRHPERVTSLQLSSLNLTGLISPYLANLTFLQVLDLSDNYLQGTIPQEIGSLFRLQYLNLRLNYLEGEIPSSLTHCFNLGYLNLRNNLLVGGIPKEIGALSKLQILNLGQNNLTGSIPPSLGNISSLLGLVFLQNSLEGSIPDSLGKLTSIQIFQVGENKLSGEIPSSLYNLSSMQYFTAGSNRLVGTLPPDMFKSLPNLQMLLLNDNQLDGHIPVSLPNASSMVELDLKSNNFSGTIPSDLGNLQYLYWMNLANNSLEARDAKDWNFLTSLTNCSQLVTLELANNRLGGVLPSSIANLSPRLDRLSMGQNNISGIIPEGIENLVNLTVLALYRNRFTGTIPTTIGKLKKLYQLNLSRNNFTGQIPSSIGNLTQLNRIYLEVNGLSGSIPVSFGNCKSLEELDLSYNKLTGAIPKELLKLSSLSTFLDLSNNALNGSLPVEVGSLRNLGQIHISENKLSGEIPSTLGDCQSLEILSMEGNDFQGIIPQSFSNLKGLQVLDLSHNNLSGQIPEFLGSLSSLLFLNLSSNDLEGKVPREGIFKNATAVSVLGNNKLCGGNLEFHLPTCYTQSSSKKHKSLTLKVILLLISGVLCLSILLCVFLVLHYTKRTTKKPASTPQIEDQFTRASYAELLKATDGFSPSNVIGVGSFGTVYKGSMDFDENIIAVKVLDLQQRGALTSFMAECEALRNIRHRNLVKIITACSSVDFQGNDFKALVLEFMPNESLEKWLHSDISDQHSKLRVLSVTQRLNIAIDVASALDYLHHHGQMPIVHCDLKPSNVLLDKEMCAHVSDFGLARFLSDEVNGLHEHSTSSIGIKGTIGYVAPEYGMGSQVSIQGDVYSYGIFLLEMFTGKRPTDEIFKDGLSLHKFAEMAIPERVMDIMDPQLFSEKEDGEANGNSQNISNTRERMHKCLVSVIGIGLSCSRELPRDRTDMDHVLKELHTVRNAFLGR